MGTGCMPCGLGHRRTAFPTRAFRRRPVQPNRRRPVAPRRMLPPDRLPVWRHASLPHFFLAGGRSFGDGMAAPPPCGFAAPGIAPGIAPPPWGLAAGAASLPWASPLVSRPVTTHFLSCCSNRYLKFMGIPPVTPLAAQETWALALLPLNSTDDTVTSTLTGFIFALVR